MCRDYTCVWYRDFPKYCVQDTEKTRKKIRQVALQRSRELRGAFMAQCFLLKRDMLVWTIGIYGVLYFNTAMFEFCAIFTSGRFIAILW